MAGSYRVEFSPGARRMLGSLSRALQIRLAERIDALALQPRPHGSKKMTWGNDIYRIRVGDYRIVYQIHGNVFLVLVLRIGHRREVYR